MCTPDAADRAHFTVPAAEFDEFVRLLDEADANPQVNPTLARLVARGSSVFDRSDAP